MVVVIDYGIYDEIAGITRNYRSESFFEVRMLFRRGWNLRWSRVLFTAGGENELLITGIKHPTSPKRATNHFFNSSGIIPRRLGVIDYLRTCHPS